MKFLYPILFLFLLSTCTTKQQNETGHEISKVIGALEIKYAQNFSVFYHEDYKVLKIHHKQDTTEYILQKQGTTLPKYLENKNIIKVPIKSIAVLSHTHIAFLQKLGLENKIVAINETAYLPDTKMLEKVKKAKVQDLGMGENINEEVLLALNPDLLMTSAINSDNTKNLQNIKNAGIPLVSNLEWQESTALGRAEWLKFVAIFFEQEDKAKEVFDKIETEYLAIKKLAQQAQTKPKVFCQVPYKSVWYMPGGKSYVAGLLKDAKTEYIWKDDASTGSLNLDFEVVYAKAKEADFWINLGSHQNIKTLLAQDKRFMDFKALQENRLYNHHKQVSSNGGNVYFMQGVVSPQLILKDLVKIFHPQLLKDYTMNYYQKLQ